MLRVSLCVVLLITLVSSVSMAATKELDVYKEFSSSEVRELIVNTDIADVRVSANGTNRGSISLNGSYEDTALSIQQSDVAIRNNILTTSLKRKPSSAASHERLRVQISLPVGMRAVTIVNTYGEIQLSRVDADKISVMSSIGNIWVDDIDAYSTKISSKSGNISVRGFSGELYCESLSGSVSAAYANSINNIRLISDSGNVSYRPGKLPLQYSISIRTKSGVANNEWLSSSGRVQKTINGIAKISLYSKRGKAILEK